MPRKKTNIKNSKNLKQSKIIRTKDINQNINKEIDLLLNSTNESLEKKNFLFENLLSETANELNQTTTQNINNQEQILNQNKTTTNNDILQNKYIAAFAYLSFLFIIPLFFKKNSAFCQKHGKQGLVWFAFQMIAAFLFFIPVINLVYGVIILTVTLNAFFQTLTGHYWRIPFLYRWAEKINL